MPASLRLAASNPASAIPQQPNGSCALSRDEMEELEDIIHMLESQDDLALLENQLAKHEWENPQWT